MNIFDDLRGMQTMLLDDDEWIRDSLRVSFETEGCPISVFETAEEALEELRRKPYDIIIFDFRLPAMDGLEFIRQVPESSSGAIKILISAYLDDKLISEMKKLPVKGILEKPFNSVALLSSLSFFIRQGNPRI